MTLYHTLYHTLIYVPHVPQSVVQKCGTFLRFEKKMFAPTPLKNKNNLEKNNKMAAASLAAKKNQDGALKTRWWRP